MTVLLDTNIVIAVLNGRPTATRERVRRAVDSGARLTVPAVVVYELSYGAAKSGRPRENADRVRAFLNGAVSVLAFDEEDADVAGGLRADLERAGTPIGPYDVLIAAQACRRDATLATANVREFERVPGLRWEDWTADPTT